MGLVRHGLDWRPPRLAELGRSPLAEGTVWARGIVVHPPGFDGRLRLFQGIEPVEVEALVAEAAVEGLDECVIHGLTRPDGLELYTAAVGPRRLGRKPLYPLPVHRHAVAPEPVVDEPIAPAGKFGCDRADLSPELVLRLANRPIPDRRLGRTP